MEKLDNQRKQRKRKIRILCLHGYMTSAKLMELQLKQWSQVYFKKNAEFVCINGYYELPQPDVNDPKLANAFGQSDSKVYSWSATRIGFQDTIDYLIQKIDELGPFDGILGFSQGGYVTHSLLLQIRQNQVQLKHPLKFAILVCTAFSDQPMQNEEFQCMLPTLHLVGENDFLFDSSILMTTFYNNPQIIFHNGGHKIPRLDATEIKKMKQFMKKAIKQELPLQYQQKKIQNLDSKFQNYVQNQQQPKL